MFLLPEASGWSTQPQCPAEPNEALFGPGALVWSGAQKSIVTQRGTRRVGVEVTANAVGVGRLGRYGSWAAASGDGLRFPNWRPNITSAMTCFVVAAPVLGNVNPETAFALSPYAGYYGKYPSVTLQFNVDPYGSYGYPGQVTLACANTTSEFACWGYDAGIDSAVHCWACSADTVDSYMLRDGVDITYPGAGQAFSGTMTRADQQFFIGAHPTYDGTRSMTSPLYLVAIVPRKMTQAEAARISQQLLKNLGAGFSERHARTLTPTSGVTVYRPGSDISVSGWVPSTGSDLFDCIDEPTASDADYITSPDLSTSATMGLTASVPAGNWAVNVRCRRMGATGSIRVVLLSSGGSPVGTSSWQPLTAGFADYSFNVTTSGAADRFRIEVQA